MNKLLYVTNLVCKDGKYIYIYISLNDFRKYAFIKNEEELIAYDNKELLDVLNNKLGIMYEANTDFEDSKAKLSIKQRLQKLLAVLGVGVTLFTVEPKVVELVSYTLKRATALSYSSIILDETSDKGFLNEFFTAINKNGDLLDEEKEKIFEGFTKYFSDWGYLLDTLDRKYILNMAENVNINRNAILPPWACASYALGNINIEKGKDSLDTVTHEYNHAFSDRGLAIGTVNGFGFGYAMNEGINTAINEQYYCEDGSYCNQMLDVLKLSLLVGNEVLIEAYQKRGSKCVVSKMKDLGIDYADAVKYISMMDIELFVDGYEVFGEKYNLPNSFYEAKDALYNKMFKSKYGYDFSETVFRRLGVGYGEYGGLGRHSFLEEKFYIKREDGFTIRYYDEVPKEVLIQKESSVDISKYFIDESSPLEYCEESYLKILAPDFKNIVNKLGSFESVYCYLTHESYNDEYSLDIREMLLGHLDEDNIEFYTHCFIHNMLSFDQTAEFMACYMKSLSDCISKKLYKSFQVLAIEELENMDRDDIIDLYCNTTIEFKSFNLDNIFESVIKDNYYRTKETKDFIITDKKLIVKVEGEENRVSEIIYDDYVVDGNYYHSALESKYWDEVFGCEGGFYQFLDLSSDLGLSDVNADDLKIRVTISQEDKSIGDIKK